VAAGLTGLGLGGLLLITLGLLAPFVELARTLVGRSSVARWRLAIRQFAMSAAIVVALDRAFWLVTRVMGVGPQADGSSARGSGGPALPVTPVLITALILLALLAITTAVGMLLGTRAPRHPSLGSAS
jgi:hypothetical protein